MSSKKCSLRYASFLLKFIACFRHEKKKHSSSPEAEPAPEAEAEAEAEPEPEPTSSSLSSSMSTSTSTLSPSPSPSPSPSLSLSPSPSPSPSASKSSSFRLMRSSNQRYVKMDMRNRGGDYNDDTNDGEDGSYATLGLDTIQLGVKPRRLRVRCLSMPSIDWEAKGSKVKGACEQVLRKGYPHLNDLFQGNPILNIHFTPSSNPHSHHASISMGPSYGFLHER